MATVAGMPSPRSAFASFANPNPYAALIKYNPKNYRLQKKTDFHVYDPKNAFFHSAGPIRYNAEKNSSLCAYKRRNVYIRASSVSTSSDVGSIELENEDFKPLGTHRTHSLPYQLTLESAMLQLQDFVHRRIHCQGLKCGIIRLQVPLPPNIKALHWLQSQPECPLLLPRIYFSPRNTPESCSKITVAGVGSTVIFRGDEPFSLKHWKSINRFLSEDSPLIRAYGAMRFDPDVQPSVEWQGFGSFYLFIPQVELCETDSCSLLAANLSWSDEASFEEAKEKLLNTLSKINVQINTSLEALQITSLSKSHNPDEQSWHAQVNYILRELKEPTNEELSKVVMARRTNLEVDGHVSPFTLLASLQEQNPFSYQFCLQLPNGPAFFGNTPEQLFSREGLVVRSEAVAATRRRGATSAEDRQLGLDLLQSSKDHTEFHIVEDGVKKAMESVCKHVKMVMTKGIIKQPKVQHLCTRFLGELIGDHQEYDLLTALHPTAAVCGHSRSSAKAAVACTETFDRGMYAGPVGWFGGQGSEFAVGIRSALLGPCSSTQINGCNAQKQRKDIFLYAGVGIVDESNPASEWHELELKISQFETLLQPGRKFEDAANINMLWACLIVEECCRLGVTHFCIAPGSRSTPLAEAAAFNPRVTCISCLDERSLAFYALGYGRGSRKPAAVVTTSGTAVSNLLPAVVEASQDCVPLLVLSADRPHELRDTGANQTINQVDHFGGFVRYHFDLPPATDEVPARMVLTTIDTAIFRATSDPYGPVHLNCPFREPLEAVPVAWDLKCLKGLSQWTTSSSPFTTYIDAKSTLLLSSSITDIIGNAKRGLIVVGGLNQPQTTWEVYKLAEHLKWPVVPDILSGLRIPGNKDNIIHNFDQVLLSSKLHPSVTPDVILQIGSRITSKRISQFLQECSPHAYILVEEHPYRHDPAHRLTHRIKSSITEFVQAVLKEFTQPLPENTYGSWLNLLSQSVCREINFQLQAEGTLTEPCIAQVVSGKITPESAIFVGNSMPIRDMDMYADASSSQQAFLNDWNIPQVITVAANRGASGIDGLISTAAGFAAGSNKRVTLLLGDLSFLHDSNGLMLLSGWNAAQQPVTVVVVNNGGGGIFSLLPVAHLMAEVPFRQLISTEHDVKLDHLSYAHKLNHVHVQSRTELEKALNISYSSLSNLIIEVASKIKENADFHRFLQKKITSHLNRTSPILLRQLSQTNRIISSFDLYSYRFLLNSRVTTQSDDSLCRVGFLVRITLSNGSSGLGEVSPLHGLHKESLLDAEEQLRLLKQKLEGVELPESIALLDGSFSEWLFKHLGPQAEAIVPSVICGLEMAALEALAASNKCSLLDLLNGVHSENLDRETVTAVRICGLIDSQGGPEELSSVAVKLVKDGFTTLKIKVARRVSPLEDAAAIHAIRDKVGKDIKLRADANRLWNMSQAIEFANAVQECDLEYIEEPVNDFSSLQAFLEQTSLRVALDETIDETMDNYAQAMQTLPSENVITAVIKPGRVGGFERSNKLARISQRLKMHSVISAAFESSVALAAYAQFAAFLDHQSEFDTPAHGLGTYAWIKRDIVDGGFSQCVSRGAVHINDVSRIPKMLWGHLLPLTEPRLRQFTRAVTTEAHQFRFRVLEVPCCSGQEGGQPTMVFLHGFLGSSEDWLPIMNSLAMSCRCLSIDLPGHGQTSVLKLETSNEDWGMDCLGEALSKLLHEITDSKVVLIGYSMGARIALYMSSHYYHQIQGVVSISGSPGVRDEHARRTRAMHDDALAESLRVCGLEGFLTTWYQKPLWRSLCKHPEYKAMKEARMLNSDVDGLADALTWLSIGRQPSIWHQLNKISVPLLLVVGKLDEKFVRIAQDMLQHRNNMKLVSLEKTGHCVHIESPLRLARILREYMVEVVNNGADNTIV